jgi:hypothetical protein
VLRRRERLVIARSLIDCEEDRTLREVLVDMLREDEKRLARRAGTS